LQTLNYSEGLRPSDSPTRSLASRFDGSLRSRGSLRFARSRRPSQRIAWQAICFSISNQQSTNSTFSALMNAPGVSYVFRDGAVDGDYMG
jgi:hypothetical protein